MFTLLVCAVGSVWSGGVAGKPPPYRGKGHRNCPIKEHPIKEQRGLQMRERAITEYCKGYKVEEIAKRAGVTGTVHPLLDCRVNSCGPTDLCVCLPNKRNRNETWGGPSELSGVRQAAWCLYDAGKPSWA